MADISVSQKSGGSSGKVWMLLAVLAVAGLMVWLSIQSQSLADRTAVVEDPAADQEPEQPAVTGEAVEIAAIAAQPDSFVDRQVQLTGVSVAGTLGERAFWAEIPGANPFLVVVSEDVAQTPTLGSDQDVNLVGTVGTVDSTLVNQWVESGAVQEGQRAAAAFARHYLRADQIEPAEPQPTGGQES